MKTLSIVKSCIRTSAFASVVIMVVAGMMLSSCRTLPRATEAAALPVTESEGRPDPAEPQKPEVLAASAGVTGTQPPPPETVPVTNKLPDSLPAPLPNPVLPATPPPLSSVPEPVANLQPPPSSTPPSVTEVETPEPLATAEESKPSLKPSISPIDSSIPPEPALSPDQSVPAESVPSQPEPISFNKAVIANYFTLFTKPSPSQETPGIVEKEPVTEPQPQPVLTPGVVPEFE